MKTAFLSKRVLSATLLGLGFASSLQAQVLLTPLYENQLESWLGQGNLSFTSLFTKVLGDNQTSSDFHAAADGRGASFVLMEVTGISGDMGSVFGLPTQVIGGYNPVSWFSGVTNIETYDDNTFVTRSLTDATRTAFIYNLTTGLLQRQNLAGQGATDSWLDQTYNSNSDGPSFGRKSDISVDAACEGGTAAQMSYGLSSFGQPATQSITVGGTGDWDLMVAHLGNGVGGEAGMDAFAINRLEVYTFTQAPIDPPNPLTPVPEPSTYGLLGAAALAGLGFYRRRKFFVRGN